MADSVSWLDERWTIWFSNKERKNRERDRLNKWLDIARDYDLAVDYDTLAKYAYEFAHYKLANTEARRLGKLVFSNFLNSIKGFLFAPVFFFLGLEKGLKHLEGLKQYEREREAEKRKTRDKILQGSYGGYLREANVDLDFFANGALYTRSFAGVDTGYASQIAPDPTMYIRGEVSKSSIDNFIKNKAQVGMAGGVLFSREIIKYRVGEEVSDYTGILNSQIGDIYRARLKKAELGVSELVVEGFGVGMEVEAREVLKSIQSNTLKYWPTILVSHRFLEEKQNYEKGEMARPLVVWPMKEANDNRPVIEKISSHYAKAYSLSRELALFVDNKEMAVEIEMQINIENATAEKLRLEDEIGALKEAKDVISEAESDLLRSEFLLVEEQLRYDNLLLELGLLGNGSAMKLQLEKEVEAQIKALERAKRRKNEAEEYFYATI